MPDRSQSRYTSEPLPIVDARRGPTLGRIPRRSLERSPIVFATLGANERLPVIAANNQGSHLAWWLIMDANPEYMHPWDLVSGDLYRLPTLS